MPVKRRCSNCLIIIRGAKFELALQLVRYGLGVRIAGSHPAGPGLIPGNGNIILKLWVPRWKN